MVSDDVDPVLTVELKRDVASAWVKREISEDLWLLSIVFSAPNSFHSILAIKVYQEAGMEYEGSKIMRKREATRKNKIKNRKKCLHLE